MNLTKSEYDALDWVATDHVGMPEKLMATVLLDLEDRKLIRWARWSGQYVLTAKGAKVWNQGWQAPLINGPS